jgi:ketosteroid isomerase-like protein
MATKIKLEEVFATIDRMDADGFAAYMADDGVFRFGSQEPVRGRQAVRDHVSGFFGAIKALRHRLGDRWEGDASLVCEGEVTYTLLDGRNVTLPFVDIFRFEGDKISDYLVYVDPAPMAG